MLGESTGRERIDDEAVDLSGEIRGTPVARTEKRLGPSDSDRWVSVARCIDWPIWQEKNAAAANTWPQPAEWPAEHYNAGRASFLPRGGPRRFSVRAIRVISPSQDQHLTNCNLILEPNENPRPPTPSLPRPPPSPPPIRPPPPSFFVLGGAWEPGQLDEKTCVFLLQASVRPPFIDRAGFLEGKRTVWESSRSRSIFFAFSRAGRAMNGCSPARGETGFPSHPFGRIRSNVTRDAFCPRCSSRV